MLVDGQMNLIKHWSAVAISPMTQYGLLVGLLMRLCVGMILECGKNANEPSKILSEKADQESPCPRGGRLDTAGETAQIKEEILNSEAVQGMVRALAAYSNPKEIASEDYGDTAKRSLEKFQQYALKNSAREGKI